MKNEIKEKNKTFNHSLKKSAIGLLKSSPMIVGTILLVSLFTTLIPASFYTKLFGKNMFLDSVIGAIIGSISAGNSITSYIFSGELLSSGVSLFAVTAFLTAWVTVGVVQLPIESKYLGKKFALLRNFTAFILSIVVALLTILILEAF